MIRPPRTIRKNMETLPYIYRWLQAYEEAGAHVHFNSDAGTVRLEIKADGFLDMYVSIPTYDAYQNWNVRRVGS